jgi:hypothetical protein
LKNMLATVLNFGCETNNNNQPKTLHKSCLRIFKVEVIYIIYTGGGYLIN